MKAPGRLVRRLLAGLALAASACAGAQTAFPVVANETDTAVLARQVLVMLPLPPPHYRPDISYGGGYTESALRAARRRTAQQLAAAYGLRIDTDWPLPALSLDCVVMTVPTDRPLPEVLQALSADRRVAWAQPMNTYELKGSHDDTPNDPPNDPLYAAQPAAAAWHLAALHERATGKGVRVAVIDSGVQADHPDLAGQVDEQTSFVGSEPYRAEHHGTQVAGIIAARAGNGIGIAGVAPGARLIALRACWEVSMRESRCSSLSLAMALHHALGQNVRVIDLSLAGPPDRLLARLLDAAMAQGIGIVAAVDRAQADGGFPASMPGVIAVVDAPAIAVSSPSSPSSQGAALPRSTLLAPGRDVPTTTAPSGWATVSGASFAAAHVAGLLALMTELNPAGTANAAAIVRQPDGRIDACATLARLQPNRPGRCPQNALDEALARH